MSSQTQEIAFESHLEETLLLKGWKQGTNAEWDKANALFPARVQVLRQDFEAGVFPCGASAE